jgi:hypothetical protein
MALSFAQTSTLDPMVAPRALALLPLSLQTMPATLSNSSTGTIGRAVRLRSVRIASQVRAPDSVVVADLVHAVALEEASEPVAGDLELAAASEEASLAAVASEAGMEALPAVVLMLQSLLLLRTLSQTLLLLGRREVKPSTCAT